MLKYRGVQALAIWAGLGFCSVATGEIVSFDYTVTSFFNVSSVVWENPAGGDANSTAAAAQLAWGTGPSGQSMLTIQGSPAMGTVVTNGAPAPTQLFTHINNPINGATLDSVTITTTLSLTWAAPPGPAPGAIGPVSADFLVNFKETPNVPGVGGCVVGAPPCPDIFALSGALNAFSFSPGDGSTYFVSIIETTGNLSLLPPAACAAAGAASPCIGFVTPENDETPAQFAFLITTGFPPLPEPGSLALLGVATLALALVRRRRP